MLQAAQGRLSKAEAVLEAEGRGKRLKQAHAQVTGRRCRMVASLGAIFSIGPLTGAAPAGISFAGAAVHRAWLPGKKRACAEACRARKQSS